MKDLFTVTTTPGVPSLPQSALFPLTFDPPTSPPPPRQIFSRKSHKVLLQEDTFIGGRDP